MSAVSQVSNQVSLQEFRDYKIGLGKVAYANILSWITPCVYCEQTGKGEKYTNSKHILNLTLGVDNSNKKLPFEFYADKFVANVPVNYKNIMAGILNTKTKQAAFDAVFKICILIVEKHQPNMHYADTIRLSENITDLKDSAVIKVATCMAIDDELIKSKDPALSRYCKPEYHKLWA